MSVKNQLLRSNAAGGVGTWEFSPELGPAKINNSIRHDAKGSLRRAKNFTSGKLYTGVNTSKGDIRQKCNFSLDVKRQEKRRLRNAKELENCRTARSQSANSPKEHRQGKSPTTVRTRSMSPTPSTPPLNAELPIRKFYNYSAKMVDQFELVKAFVVRQPELAESLHEINRQRKRATEFAVRFSRNNLYQMKRLVNEIKQIIVPYPFDNLAKSDSDVLCRKILLAYQTATQALQTYINYMRSSSNLDVPEKTRELILLIMDLYLCCEHLSLPCDQVDILGSCKELVALLDVKVAEFKGKTPMIRQIEKFREAEKEDNRFSMYKTKLTNSTWKKKTEALAKVKFGVPKLSYLKRMKKREDTPSIPKATFEIYSQKIAEPPCNAKSSKTVPDVSVKPGKQTEPEKAAAPVKKTHFTPREVTSQDDDIETVVQSIDDDESVVPNRIYAGSEDQIQPEPCDEEGNHLNKADVRDLVMQAIEEMQSTNNCDVKNSLRKLLKSLNTQTVGREAVQPKNVKVLHVISNDPIPEEPEEEVATQREKEETVTETNNDRKTDDSVVIEKRKKRIFQSIAEPFGAITSNGRTSMKVSEESSNAIMKYKKVLSDYRRNNVMYKRGIPIRPCELVLRISDQIINDVLHEISSGMENENLLKQLYYSELLEVF